MTLEIALIITLTILACYCSLSFKLTRAERLIKSLEEEKALVTLDLLKLEKNLTDKDQAIQAHVDDIMRRAEDDTTL